MTTVSKALEPGTAGPTSRPAAPSQSAADPAVRRERHAPIQALLGAGGATGDTADPIATRLRPARRTPRLGFREDPLFALSVALVLPVLAMEVIVGSTWPEAAIVASAVFLALQAAAGRARQAGQVVVGLRFTLCMAYVAFANWALIPGDGWPLLSLVVPIVGMAAASGGVGAWIAGGALILNLLPVVTLDLDDETRRQLVAITMSSAVVAIGSHRIVTALGRSRDRLRRAQMLQRRRSRHLNAVEAVGRTLAREGPSPAALDTVVGLLVDPFGYRYPSIFTWDGRALRMGAQRNYALPLPEFSPESGVIGRIVRTREPVFLPDVTVDPDYVAGDPEVTGEIAVPLFAEGDLVGVLNVEMGHERRLDADDFATVQIVGDRIAAALALGRERQKLSERAQLMDALASFSRTLGRSLDPETVQDQVAAGAARVIWADMVVLVLQEPATGEYRATRVEGGERGALGTRILPGEGVTGRAIATGALVVVDRLERAAFPRAAAHVRLADTVAAMGAPLATDNGIMGSLAWFREDLEQPFSDQERDVATLLANQVALAITNADLHHATELAAVTDGLTGLHNRRFFDASMARAEAARKREAEADRRPRSAVMFDLDHFGQVNKLHGHQVGDRILRAFADVLRARVRASDLVARYGGEEFVVVLEGATRDEAVRLADEIRESFARSFFALPDGAAIGCTVSAGCSALDPAETSGAALLERADVGLAMAKASGRNRVVAA